MNIDNIVYENIGEIFNNCLDMIIPEKDYESANIIINISTTLYKMPDEPNKSNRIFLQDYLSKHKIWNNFNFWKELIFYNIIEEMHKQKNFKLYFEENEKEKQNRINKIAKIQLNTFVYHMLSFDTKKIIITDIIQDFREYYKLEDSVSDSLLKTVDDYKNKNDDDGIFSSGEKKREDSEEETKNNSIEIKDNNDLKESNDENNKE